MTDVPQLPKEAKQTEESRKSTSEATGGVELVPLFAKRRAEAIRLPLNTTDVTNLEK